MTKWKEQRKDEREREEEIQNTPFIHVLGEGREQNHRGNNRPPVGNCSSRQQQSRVVERGLKDGCLVALRLHGNPIVGKMGE